MGPPIGRAGPLQKVATAGDPAAAAARLRPVQAFARLRGVQAAGPRIPVPTTSQRGGRGPRDGRFRPKAPAAAPPQAIRPTAGLQLHQPGRLALTGRQRGETCDSDPHPYSRAVDLALTGRQRSETRDRFEDRHQNDGPRGLSWTELRTRKAGRTSMTCRADHRYLRWPNHDSCDSAYGLSIATRMCRGKEPVMLVAAGLGVLVVFCLLLSMVQTPPAIGR
jgi:hypothetical protein